MKLKDILYGAGILEKNIKDICYNAKYVKKDSIFVAIEGIKFDGHNFINQALKNGATAIILEKTPKEDVAYIKVDNSRRALAIMSKNFFSNPCKNMKIIGVTGTNGKTSTTYYIKHILENLGKKVGLIGTNEIIINGESISSERTTPESYELYKIFRDMDNKGCEYVVMEVSSHALYLDRVYGVDFESAVFTNLSSEHLDFHENMENYAKAKAKLLENSKNKIINIDDDIFKNFSQDKNFTFAINNLDASYIAKDIKYYNSHVSYKINNIFIDVNGVGRFTVYNTMSAIMACNSLGFSILECANALKNMPKICGRAELAFSNEDFSVIIDYAHTDDGIKNILSSIRTFAKGRIVAVFGCGGNRDKSKRAKMAKACEEFADYTIVTSDNPRDEEPMDIISDIMKGFSNTNNVMIIKDRKKAIKFAMQNALKYDIIVLMGKGHEKYQEINGEKIYLDERDIIEKLRL